MQEEMDGDDLGQNDIYLIKKIKESLITLETLENYLRKIFLATKNSSEKKKKTQSKQHWFRGQLPKTRSPAPLPFPHSNLLPMHLFKNGVGMWIGAYTPKPGLNCASFMTQIFWQ